MKKVFLLIICLVQLSLSATPTERHLEDHPIEEIINVIGPELTEKVPFLIDISKKEYDDVFFGYHGMSQDSRLFQDILKVLFEEVLNIQLPHNFYFLRIPGSTSWNWENGKESFLEKFSNRKMPEFHRRLIMQNFLSMIESNKGYKIPLENFSENEVAILWNYFQSFLDFYVSNDLSTRLKTYSVPQDYSLTPPLFNQHLPAVADVINRKLIEYYPEADRVSFRAWLEEMLAETYDIERIFQLRELDLEDKSHIQFIDTFFFPFDDTTQPQQSMLVSMNVSLFGNYEVSGCFTPGILMENSSVLEGDNNLEKLLREFFDSLGLDPSLVDLMWSEGKMILEEEGVTTGAILQFYDESAFSGVLPFSFVDKNVFVCIKHGKPVPGLIPSKYIQGDYLLTKNSKDLELRLVMNNHTTLNPFSSIRMVRHESLSEEASQKILFKIKEHLKNSSRDSEKIQSYVYTLESLWERELPKCDECYY